jgi:glutathione S-transferase
MVRADLLLVGEGFSPWTEKARWALEHHGIAFDYDEYTPLMSEPWLRIRARRLRGPVSVPYLLARDGSLSLGDSFAIAREADRRAGANELVPPDLDEEITQWNDRAERLMRAGRAQILAKTEEDKEVAMESLPSHIPKALRSTLSGTVRLGTSYLRKKYKVEPIPDEALEADLQTIREVIERNSGKGKCQGLVKNRFTLADIAIITALQAIRPHKTEPVGLAPAQRKAWSRPELASRFEDVLSWRDEMLSRHRH